MLHEDSHAFQGYGTIVARGWYMELPDAVRHIVDEASFGTFCMGLSRLTASQPLLGSLVERWWDNTDSFHLSTAGEMTMTPFDFSMLTGIGVGGHPIPYDTDMGEWDGWCGIHGLQTTSEERHRRPTKRPSTTLGGSSCSCLALPSSPTGRTPSSCTS
ncbi:hypothetical protein CsSME_00001830 [Camellia sinensis var. sinensis]